jgi:hypothetical protein
MTHLSAASGQIKGVCSGSYTKAYDHNWPQSRNFRLGSFNGKTKSNRPDRLSGCLAPMVSQKSESIRPSAQDHA